MVPGRKAARGRAVAKGQAGSPTLPMLRNSERSTLKRCEFLWDITYNRKLKPYTDMPALRFGSLIHKAMAGYYIPGKKRGLHPRIGFEQAYETDLKENQELFGMRVDDDDKWVDALELGIGMMDNYVDEYGKDDEWEVLVTEHPFETIVYRPESYDPNYPPEAQATAVPWFVFVGVLDGVWRYLPTKDLWMPEHKSTAGIGGTKKYPKIPPHLMMDDQAGSYWSFGVQALIEQQIMKQNQHLTGMLYNYLRKALPDERPSRLVNGERLYLNKPKKEDYVAALSRRARGVSDKMKLTELEALAAKLKIEVGGEVSKAQPSPYFARINIQRDEYDRNMARTRAEIDFKRAELLRSGELEMTKSPGMFTCPGCPAKDACELHETGSDWEAFLTGTTKTWDPYDEHEVYAGR